MRAFFTTHEGLEKFGIQEANELIGTKIPRDVGCPGGAVSIKGKSVAYSGGLVFFKVNNFEEIAKFAYCSRSVRRVCFMIDQCSAKDFEVFCDGSRGVVDKFDFSSWIKNGMSFKVVCDRFGDHDFSSHDAEIEVGASVMNALDKAGIKSKVNLENPDVVIYCYIRDSNAFLGIDFAGEDLSKREYKLFNNYHSFKSNIAYSLVRLASPGKVLLDPFCGDGAIGIEASLFAQGKSVNSQKTLAFSKLLPLKGKDLKFDCQKIDFKVFCFDNTLKNINMAKNNAKIASADISFSKVSVDALDTQFEEGSVDSVVTQPPQLSKNKPEKQILKVYDELFYQTKYLLSDDGCLVALVLHKEKFLEIGKKHDFELSSVSNVKVGENDYSVVKIMKGAKRKV